MVKNTSDWTKAASFSFTVLGVVMIRARGG
jgi:hypothetical protein